MNAASELSEIQNSSLADGERLMRYTQTRRMMRVLRTEGVDNQAWNLPGRQTEGVDTPPIGRQTEGVDEPPTDSV